MLLGLSVAFYFFKKPGLPIPIPFLKSENLTNNQEVKGKQSDALTNTYNHLVKTATSAVDDAKEKVYQNSQNTLDNIFDKKTTASAEPSTNISVVVTNEVGKSAEKVVMDLASTGSLKFNLTKGKDYYLEFKNILSGNCLFIGSNSYELRDGTVLKVAFAENGTYKVKTGPCAILDKEIGELVVN